MFKISAFSKLSRVSVKTLRYYDELGLLKPAMVDESSGYRYYSAEQLLTVQRIIAFKELGLTLEEIIPLLSEQATSELVIQTLTSKREELEHAIREAQRQRDEIDRRLHRMDKAAEKAEDHPVTLRRIEPQFSASIRDVIPRTHVCLLLDELKQYVNSYGEDADGTLTILWHDCGGEDDTADIEVAVQIARDIPSGGRVKVAHLPGLTLAASLVHDCDPYARSCSSTAELAVWITSNGYRPSETEPVREMYLTADKDMYGRLRKAEVLIPIDIA